MIDKTTLPLNWATIKISDVGCLIRGVNYKKEEATCYAKKGSIPILRANNIDGELNFTDLIYVPKKYINDEQSIRTGDILIAMSSGSKQLVGKSAQAVSIFECSIGAFCAIFRVHPSFNNSFIAYYFQSPYYKDYISRISKGTNINNLKKEHILSLVISIPPYLEQQQISDKIKNLFSDLDAGRQLLETTKEQLKTYRQAVLNWAFEGRFTSQQVIQGNLPEGWNWVLVRDIALDIQYGHTETASKKNVGPKFLRITDIQDNRVDWNTVPYCKISIDELEKKKLKDGDLLFARTGATVGKSFLIKGEIPESVFASYLIRIRFPEHVSDKYVWFFFQSNLYWKQIFEGQVGTGQPNVNGKKLGEIFLPIPPFSEQQKIVKILESRFLDCDKLIEIIESCLQHNAALKQSILKQAFEGKLVKP